MLYGSVTGGESGIVECDVAHGTKAHIHEEKSSWSLCTKVVLEWREEVGHKVHLVV